MPDLTTAEVQALAAALELPMRGEDLVEVTHRLNAFLEALGPLAALPLVTAGPVPTLPWHRAPGVPGAAGVRVWHLMSRLTGTSDGATTRGRRSC